MKIYKISSKTVSIGNVGAFGSDGDKNRLHMVYDWLATNDWEYAEGISFTHDEINLSNGRDFLRENNSYGIVILHHIFNPKDENDKRQGIFLTSPHHKKEVWINRLASTGADYIFVFGSWTEISGGWIGNIPGYDVFHGRSEYQTVFRKSNMPKIEGPDTDKPIDWDNLDLNWMKGHSD